MYVLQIVERLAAWPPGTCPNNNERLAYGGITMQANDCQALHGVYHREPQPTQVRATIHTDDIINLHDK